MKKNKKDGLQEYLASKVPKKFLMLNKNHVHLMLQSGCNLWGCYYFMSLISGEEKICKFSQAGLAKRLCLSERTVKRIFKQLQAFGLIEGVTSGTIGGDNIDTPRIYYRVFDLTDDKIKQMTNLSGDNIDTDNDGQPCPIVGDKLVIKPVTTLSNKKQEKNLQEVEKKDETAEAAAALLDRSIRSSYYNKINKEINARVRVNAPLGIFEEKKRGAQMLLDYPLRELQEKAKEMGNKIGSIIDDFDQAYANTLPDVFPSLKTAVSIGFGLLAAYWRDRYTIEDWVYVFSTLEKIIDLVEQEDARMKPIQICEYFYLMLRTKEESEYGYWYLFVKNRQLSKLLNSKKKFYLTIYQQIPVNHEEYCAFVEKIIFQLQT